MGVLRTAGIAALALCGAIVLYSLLTAFADRVLNGVFMDWVAESFLNQPVLDDAGVSAELALDTRGVRYFFFELGVAVVFVIVAVAAAASFVAARHRERQTVDRAAGLLATYLAHDLDARRVFPEGYEELALEAASIRRASEEQARALADEAARKNDLITYLAHDLKTPLTSVIGYLSLLDEVPDMPGEQRCRYVGVALDKALRLERLINEFFDITRYNLSKMELELAPVDLAFLLVQVADEFYPVLAAHKNALVVEVEGTPRTAEAPGAPLEMTADAARLARVLANLLRNAVAYSREGTDIRVSAARMAPDLVRIEVTDTGSTIPSHKLDTIFDRFFRLDEARASATGGAGLGLAIAREIVELHGGTIAAASENGVTTFTVELPTTVPPAA